MNDNDQNTRIETPLQLFDSPFEYFGHNVRTAISEAGIVSCCAKDIAEVLGVTWDYRRVKKLPQQWSCTVHHTVQSGTKGALYLSEPGVYAYCLKSQSPSSDAVMVWICEEVIPAIRKFGFYGKVKGLAERKSLSVQYVACLKIIMSTKDAFILEALMREFRSLCNMLGYPMPPLENLGQDFKQLAFPGMKPIEAA